MNTLKSNVFLALCVAVIAASIGIFSVVLYGRFTGTNARRAQQTAFNRAIAKSSCVTNELLRTILADAASHDHGKRAHDFYQRQFKRIDAAEKVLPVKCQPIHRRKQ